MKDKVVLINLGNWNPEIFRFGSQPVEDFVVIFMMRALKVGLNSLS